MHIYTQNNDDLTIIQNQCYKSLEWFTIFTHKIYIYNLQTNYSRQKKAKDNIILENKIMNSYAK